MPARCRRQLDEGRGWLAAGVAPLLLVCACSSAGHDPSGGPVVITSSSSASTSAPSSPSSPSPSSPTVTTPSSTAARPSPTVTTASTIATGLDVPWAVGFLPDGTALVTLRDRAQVLRIPPGESPRLLGTVPGVVPGGEGGLLGLAVSPRFVQDHHVFVYFTAAQDNRVVQLTLTGGRLTDPTTILTGIPKADHHNGGRLAFGPDGFLYVTTGDAGQTEHAQDRRSLGGKILRVTMKGRPAPGNPFAGSPIWSYGHRNVQGIAWTADGTMYASEFGQNTWDELNLIRPGRNYGWPVVEGRAGRAGLVDPLVQWPTDDASPSGIAIADGAVFLTALRGESLWRVPIRGNGVGTPQRLLHSRYGRLRDVVLGPDHRLWVLTSNTFRGSPRPGDDRLVALPVAGLR